MPKVRVNGIDLNYTDAASGGAVAVDHGVGGDHLAWAFQVPAFSAKYRVITFDNRGAGQSSVPDVPYSTQMMADDAVGLLDTLGIERAHVPGGVDGRDDRAGGGAESSAAGALAAASWRSTPRPDPQESRVTYAQQVTTQAPPSEWRPRNSRG